MLSKNSEIVDDLMASIQSIKNKSQNNVCICEVYDSKIYQKTLQNCKIYDKKNCITLTYNFSTDGAPVFKNSKNSFWPLQIIINKLSPQIRFKNIILAAICVLDSEPNYEFIFSYNFLHRKSSNIIHNGINVFF